MFYHLLKYFIRNSIFLTRLSIRPKGLNLSIPSCSVKSRVLQVIYLFHCKTYFQRNSLYVERKLISVFCCNTSSKYNFSLRMGANLFLSNKPVGPINLDSTKSLKSSLFLATIRYRLGLGKKDGKTLSILDCRSSERGIGKGVFFFS